MIEIHHVSMDDEIDCYDFVTLELERPIEEWEHHDILEIVSIYHFFECINTEWDGVEEVFKHLINLYESGDFSLI